MIRVAAVVAGVALLALGGAAGWLLARETEDVETVTTTVTDTETVTETSVEAGFPAEVAATRRALLAAAETGDYEALRPYLSERFRYTFGGPVEGGPVAFWRELERTTDERPLETLAAVLRMPYTLARGVYVWPFAFTVDGVAALSAHERTLLAPLGSPIELFVPGTGYLGWRAGIEPNGTWVFFLAGD